MRERLHIAVEARNLARDGRGIGRYARAVLRRMIGDERIEITLAAPALFPDRRGLARAIDAASVRVSRAVPRDAQVTWFPWNGVSLASATPIVATVHDATPFAFPARDRSTRKREQTPFLRTAALARRILVQSRFTASEVERRLGVEPDRIVVTPLACDAVFTPGQPDQLPAALERRRYILHVGAHDERKNSETLIAAYARAFPRGEVALAFTNRPPVIPDGAVVVESRDDATLVALYRGAALVAVPSTYEGFGLPLLEAMACGTPALAARAGALPEVGGDACGYVDEAHSVDAWAEALSALLRDDDARAALAARGPARAAIFSWDRCTAQTLAVLEEAAR